MAVVVAQPKHRHHSSVSFSLAPSRAVSLPMFTAHSLPPSDQTRPEQTSAGPFFSRPGQSTASEIAAHPTLISILPLELDSP